MHRKRRKFCISIPAGLATWSVPDITGAQGKRKRPPSDTTAPSVPTGLTAQAVSSSQINLNWNASTDNVGVIGYYVYVNDTPFTPTTTTSFSHTGLAGGTTYRYRVSAFDAAYNYSEWSESVAATTFSTQTVVEYKGICPNELYFLHSTAIADAVTRMQALGVRWVRLDFDWSVMQPTGPNDSVFTGHEAVVRALGVAGIKVLGIIDYTPSWANGGKPSKYYPPLNATDYANFASRLVSYFGPLGVHTWEIWNEQNLGNFWVPAPNPSAYVALLQAAYTAIHRLDATAVVITGGLAQVANTTTTMHVLDFVANMYRYGAAGYFDAVGDHPYDSPRLPSESYNWHLMFATSPSIRSIMTANGDAGKRIWITEFGAPTNGTSPWGTVVTESRQAQILAEAYALVPTYTWAGPLFWYNFRDFCPYDPNSSADCFYGLIRYDGSNKSGAESYRIAPN